MDGPLGPCQPDKRNEANEFIFDHPSASHHQLNAHLHGVPYSQLIQQPYPPTYQCGSPADRHTSPSSPFAPTPDYHAASQQHVQTACEQPYQQLTRAGLTSAQADQAQVYLNSPAAKQSDWNNAPNPPQNGGPHHRFPNEILRMGVNIEPDMSRLSIDSRDDHDSDEASSELPWAQSRDTPVALVSRSIQQGQQHQSHLSPSSISPHPYPPQLDTAIMSTRSSLISTPSVSSTLVERSIGTTSCRSSDSACTVAGGPGYRDPTTQDRSLSMSTTSPSMRTLLDAHSHLPVPHMNIAEGRNSHTTSIRAPGTVRKTTVVYPALLSNVAAAFRERINLADRIKDGLTYKDAFDGQEAADKLAYIIKTTDRNIALLVGRALGAQNYFHDVTYVHRLRDNAYELYQFHTKLSPFVSGQLPTSGWTIEDEKGEWEGSKGDKDLASPAHGAGSNDSHEKDVFPSLGAGEMQGPRARRGGESIDEIPLPSGVFTLLTDCYSPTCTRDQLCYSIACPRRLEQPARLNMKPQPELKKQISRESLGDRAVSPLSCLLRLLLCR
ncbi:hypothetical protein BV22DRAFT_1037307 [Leucogyrophana mollusca]|uniref:Uncharacterized protein n=1 Tax=Leucogyrophana mollusca TaxID=85980 RepID=A0ACB8BA64_9AGAM|nr:hypothetical protein BV22DRAFT_1037307 [Leucogyrophana mollusca]